jgi:small subunit ribosomal protein S19
MARSLKKGPYIDERLVRKLQASGGKGIKTWSRSATITPEMVGSTVEVHNGRRFLPVHMTENMVGHKLGEFSPTRTFRGHGGKMAKEQAKAATAAAAPAAAKK